MSENSISLCLVSGLPSLADIKIQGQGRAVACLKYKQVERFHVTINSKIPVCKYKRYNLEILCVHILAKVKTQKAP